MALDGTLVHDCEQCGFRDDGYSTRDLTTSPQWLTAMADDMTAPVDADILAGPPITSALTELRSTIDAIAPSGSDGFDTERVHAAIHRLRDLGRALHEAGAGAPTQMGSVAQVATSDGGAPKSAVPTADVGRRGLLGDRQANRKHHGRPFQALCLWSTEVIDDLVAEGHPIHAGAAGENITVSGIDWTTLRPGVRVLIGQVLCEISAWATPCRKIDQWFKERSDRIDHDRHPGWSRAYAWVLEPGTIATGDPVIVEP